MYPFSGLRGLAATKTSFHLLELEQDAGIRMAALTAGSTANHLALSSASRRPDRNTLQGLRQSHANLPCSPCECSQGLLTSVNGFALPVLGGLSGGRVKRFAWVGARRRCEFALVVGAG